MNKFSLSNLISKRICDRIEGWKDFSAVLTDKQVENFVALFGHGCQQKTKESLYYAAKNNFNGVKNVGILGRVEFGEYDADSVSYCAGQNYPEEITIVRNHIKKYY